MNVKEVKQLRSQIRIAVKEELAGVLSTELLEALEKRIVAHVNYRLDIISKQVEDSLKAMDTKVSNGVNYLVRHTGQMPMSVTPTALTPSD